MPTQDSTRRAAEHWFLDKGLPSVLTPRARWRALWPRSAPVLAGYATLMIAGLGITLLVGNVRVDIDGEPTTKEWIVLGILVACIPVVVLTGWLVSRPHSYRSRFLASTIAAAVALVSGALISDAVDVAGLALALLVVPLLTATGLGSVVSWALRLAVSQLSLVG